MLEDENVDFTRLSQNIKSWGKELGFAETRITHCQLEQASEHLQQWLNKGRHGNMSYMANNINKRSYPHLLHEGTVRIITVRMNYSPQVTVSKSILKDSTKAYVARYALGRDYHKLMRKKLTRLAQQINDVVPQHHYRAFTDSAPVLERAIAENAGHGWIGKNTMLIQRQSGSYFFLGELFTNIPLPVDRSTTAHCGSCHACIDICPTQAIVAPYQLDARRCISYLTIENKGPIPVEFRRAIGNRIFGCDDCQLICPWNKFAKPATEPDFQPRHQLDNSDLATLFRWTEDEFNSKTAGSAIKRTGYIGWLRNIAIALGNARSTPEVLQALQARQDHPNELVREHVHWALQQHQQTS